MCQRRMSTAARTAPVVLWEALEHETRWDTAPYTLLEIIVGCGGLSHQTVLFIRSQGDHEQERQVVIPMSSTVAK